MTDAIVEAAARALEIAQPLFRDYDVDLLAKEVVAAVAPLIRAAALEKAAVTAELIDIEYAYLDTIAAHIRALKEQP